MVNSKTIICALALSALTASASTLSNRFSINQVPINISRIHPAAKYARAHTKYGVYIPDYITLAARSGNPDVADSVAADPYQNDIIYLSPIKVGNNELLVEFDTGSSELWVKTSESPGAGPSTYDPSTGTLLPNYHWHIEYGDGSTVGGKVYIDEVMVGNIRSHNQAIEIADYINAPEILRDVIDGIMGLGFFKLNKVQPIPQLTFFENVKASLDTPVFAAYLRHLAPGSFDFGYINPQKYTGTITYVDVDHSQGYWNITWDGFSVGPIYSAVYPFHVIVDTGTSLLLLDDFIVGKYYTHITTAYYAYQHGGWVFDCREDLPYLSLKIGAYEAFVLPEYLKYADLGGNVCYGGIQRTIHEGYSILGTIFLKTQYVIFDDGTTGSPQVGFAKQA
ncbi:hypothetical protein TMatcc_011229 [Talaromyces marneffei ATCC 18224]|uniref:Aspergillopepsin A, putative n=1 Tax=Talaromyces marneffei (strain ATCC 18224 / CBS 334.59 / QM 7333) TaxID=441960 RepID=B6QWF9_TALMQ|nr:uncharacterized protein EYB26_010036 [Talaromyces marneffei]EEA18538.1 aspergillopepsin A precursor, putative [Talaromyces marneffei ATCC 18224]KAE8548986.1 hypothetical protein EYB25_009369 [Talaromyces marneffei]QGA22320.1 hypothetical protein EYB26_010036 [Talaromyces marneffei]